MSVTTHKGEFPMESSIYVYYMCTSEFSFTMQGLAATLQNYVDPCVHCSWLI